MIAAIPFNNLFTYTGLTGELDISDDAAWEAYVSGVKSQAADFDGILATMNAKAIK